jgi:glycosyltransferase domain-containing protein
MRKELAVTTMAPQITIAVPTHNRPAFFNRLLMFFDQVQCGVPILIVDSSAAETRVACRSVVEGVQSRLDIKYRHVDLPFEQKCLAAFDDISTPYVMFCADDDFVIPSTLPECVSFLDANPDYATARGVQYILDTVNGHKLKKARYREVTHPDPVARFHYIADSWFSNFYCVYRTHELRRDFELTCEYTSTLETIILPELMLSYLSVMRGKCRYLPCLSGLVQSHSQCVSRTAAKISDPEKYADQYLRFESCLAKVLAQAADITEDEARELVKKYHGPARAVWEQRTPIKPGMLAWLRRETARPIRQVQQFFRHGMMAPPWKSHPIVPGDTQSESFLMMRDLMSKYPDGCPLDQTKTQQDAA